MECLVYLTSSRRIKKKKKGTSQAKKCRMNIYALMRVTYFTRLGAMLVIYSVYAGAHRESKRKKEQLYKCTTTLPFAFTLILKTINRVAHLSSHCASTRHTHSSRVFTQITLQIRNYLT